MTDNASVPELIERLVRQSGITKKLAAEILRVLPEIIEEGLKKDGEVRVRGLGTFRMKWTQQRTGRNPKTGEIVEIPPHNRIVFLPEQSLKEFANRDNRLLSYKVVPVAEEEASQQSTVGSQQSVVGNHLEPETRSPEPETTPSEIDYSYEPEPEKPVRRKRIHWIIPTAILVIIGLSIAFYFRNFNPILKKPELKKQEAYIVTKDSMSSQQSAVGGQQSAVGSQQLTDSVKQEKLTTPNSSTLTQDSKLKTQNSEGKHLFQIAREVYGNPFLWTLIYKENLDKIPAPDVVIAGKELVIPVLEGQPRKLSHNDSVNVAEGYRLVYEYYLDKGDPKAEEFMQTYQRYLPK